MDKRRYLVTGGAGFIGSHIVEELVRQGCFVRVMDNLSNGRIENLHGFLNKIEFLRGDLRERQDCVRAVRLIDCVVHQAALRSVPKSLLHPQEYNAVNIQGTLNLLQASVEQKVMTFVFASSSSVYGDTRVFPEKEDAPLAPISPYALTKLTGEHYCRMFSYHYRLSTTSLRYFNVFGPRQSLDDEYAVVVPKFINCILHDEHPPVYGTGRQSRDFTYVSNVVRANLIAAQRERGKGEVFNVASGQDYSVLELVDILNALTGKNIKPKLLPPRRGDVFRTLADLSYAKRRLKFKPEVDFIQGLKRTLEHFKSHA